MDLSDIAETQHLRREDAAGQLHQLADTWHGATPSQFQRDAAATSKCPTRSSSKIEVGQEDHELEIDLTW